MNKWFSEGLIDPDFPTRTADTIKTLISSDKAGAVIESPDTMGSLLDPMNIKISGAPYPVLNKGDKLRFRFKQWNTYGGSETAITTSCKDPQALAR